MESIATIYTPQEEASPVLTSEATRNGEIRVLLIEDNVEQADLVKLNLAEGGDTEFRVEWVPNLVAAINRLAQPGIDVSVLDLGMPELLGPRSHRAIRLTAPDIPVVILTADDHVDSKDLTLAAGAEEYLVKGRSSPGELKQAIRRAFYRKQFRSKLLHRKPASTPGFAVAFLGAKGGVGTTSALLNITEALAAQHAAIAFETASQGGFAFQMDNHRSPDGARSAPLKLDREWLSRSVEPTSNGAGVLFTPLLPWRGTDAANGIAKQMLRLAKTSSDFVMIDAGCHLDGLTAALASECQTVVIVVDCEPSSTGAARETLRLLQPLSRPSCEVVILAINRSGLANPPTIDQLQTFFGKRVLGVVPHSGGPSEWTTNRNAPFAVMNPEGASTSSYLEIAWRLSEDAAARRGK
jgi:DNA-binding response OmpR family regulator